MGDNPEMPAVDTEVCIPGRVLRVHGLFSFVEAEDGRLFRCTVRRLLRTLATDERNIVPGFNGRLVYVERAGDEHFYECLATIQLEWKVAPR